MTASLLSCVNAGLVIDGYSILSDISLETNARRVGIIGRNGSGKTSLTRLLSGLIAPSSGEIRLLGTDPAKDRKAALGLVGILFQNPDHQIIFPTVIEEVTFGLKQQKRPDPEEHARQELRRHGKIHWQHAHIFSLSQGQKQLVCLMSILAMEPKILILDEPFAGLDIPTRLQLQRYLDDYDGMVVHVSHEPRDLELYDQVIWIDRGKLRDQGNAGDILARYKTEMTKLGAGDDLSKLSD